MTTEHIAVPALVFNGVEIHDRNEMLCLTDMWKAGGSDTQHAPAKWRALPSAKAFIDHVEVTIGKSDSELFVVNNGGRQPGTWAHWQIALAYAKYLSPEFHMWCNTVVRERMEGQSAQALPAATLEQIERSFGIIRMLAHKVTETEKVVNTLPALIETVNALTTLVQPAAPGLIIRHGKTAGAILKAAGYTNCPQCLAVWFGNRLEAAGCRVEGRIDTGTSRSRLFDPDKAEAWLENGGRQSVEMKLLERKGQGALALAGRPARHLEVPPDMHGEGLGLIVLNGEPVFYDSNDFDPRDGDKVVVLLVDGELVIEVADAMKGFRSAKFFASYGPRHCMSAERPMLSVKGRETTGQLPGFIIGKVVERRNVIPLPAREIAAH